MSNCLAHHTWARVTSRFFSTPGPGHHGRGAEVRKLVCRWHGACVQTCRPIPRLNLRHHAPSMHRQVGFLLADCQVHARPAGSCSAMWRWMVTVN